MKFFKKVFIWAIVLAAIYFLLSYHFIIIEKTVRLLPKKNLTLKYTIYSTSGTTNEKILDIDPLWEAGIADLLIEMGRMTKEELEEYEAKFEEEE